MPRHAVIAIAGENTTVVVVIDLYYVANNRRRTGRQLFQARALSSDEDVPSVNCIWRFGIASGELLVA